jgi:hypothetical protein
VAEQLTSSEVVIVIRRAPALLLPDEAETQLRGWRMLYPGRMVHLVQRRAEVASTEVRAIEECSCVTCQVALPGACALVAISREGSP